MKHNHILVIIPARGGSVSIPRKNLQDLGGKPLLAWAIQAAKGAEKLDNGQFRIMVNTEDAEIAKIAKKYGAEVFERPMPLAEDVPTEHVIFHQLNEMKKDGYEPEFFICLQCTTPLLRPYDIVQTLVGLRLFKNKDGCVSMKRITEFPQWFFKPIKGKQWNLEALFWEVEPWLQNIIGLIGVRQKLPQMVIPNGAIYTHKTKAFLKSKSMFGRRGRTVAYIMPFEYSFDVDDPADLETIRAIVEWRKKQDGKKDKSKKKTKKDSRSRGKKSASR